MRLTGIDRRDCKDRIIVDCDIITQIHEFIGGPICELLSV